MNGVKKSEETEIHLMDDDARWDVHVEVRMSPHSSTPQSVIRTAAEAFVSRKDVLSIPETIGYWHDDSILGRNVELIHITESASPVKDIPTTSVNLIVHVYQPINSEFEDQFANGGEENDDVPVVATVCELPARVWEGLWDTLVYDDDIKSDLLNYIYATFRFSDANIDHNIVAWNRIVLLHGPPGTGKTSLARALAQKLAIRLQHRYSAGTRLMELNAHSLFSRWFSESGKLVQRAFSGVMEMADDPDIFLVLLIDEVESLTAARAGAMSGTEPSDALRVVNALLTQLDKLKLKNNVLIISTSNLPDAIDSAYVDRADIVQYVGLPSRNAIYTILQSCVTELVKHGMIRPIETLSMHEVGFASHDNSLHEPVQATDSEKVRSAKASVRLLNLASRCAGKSGRSLRRLPVLAYSRMASSTGSDISIWLDAMEKTIAGDTAGRQWARVKVE